jgi:hypothetical protein
LGALLLSFRDERSRRRNPVDRLQPPVANDHPLDDDPTEFLSLGRRRGLDGVRQREDPRPIRVEGPDPVTVGQFGEVGLRRVPPCEVLGIGEIAPGVLLLELFQSRRTL